MRRHWINFNDLAGRSARPENNSYRSSVFSMSNENEMLVLQEICTNTTPECHFGGVMVDPRSISEEL